MNYVISILEIKDLDNSKYPDALPKSTIKATFKPNSKLAKASIVYIQILTSDSKALSIGEVIELEKSDFELTVKELEDDKSITILKIV